MYTNNKNKTIGSIVKFACESGYEIQGHEQITCQNGGVWSASIPSCVHIVMDES